MCCPHDCICCHQDMSHSRSKVRGLCAFRHLRDGAAAGLQRLLARALAQVVQQRDHHLRPRIRPAVEWALGMLQLLSPVLAGDFSPPPFRQDFCCPGSRARCSSWHGNEAAASELLETCATSCPLPVHRLRLETLSGPDTLSHGRPTSTSCTEAEASDSAAFRRSATKLPASDGAILAAFRNSVNSSCRFSAKAVSSCGVTAVPQ